MSELFYSDFTGGMNDTTPPDLLNENELVLCENAFPGHNGGIKKRSGCSKFIDYKIYRNKPIEWLHDDGTSSLITIADNIPGMKIIESTGLISQTSHYSGLGYYWDVFAHVQCKGRLYFTALVGDAANTEKLYEFLVWGDYQYTTAAGSVTLKDNDIVKNHPYNGKGIADHYYRYDGENTTINLATVDFESSQFEDITYKSIPNDIRRVVPYNDSTNDLEPIKKCKFMVLHEPSKRIFAAGNPDDPGALYFSEIDKPDYFKKTSRVYPTNAAGPITGLICVEDAVLVSYIRGWYMFSGIFPGVDAVWKQLSIPEGAANNDAICLTPNSITFASQKGLWIMNTTALSSEYIKIPTENMFVNISEKKIKNTYLEIFSSNIQLVYHDNNVLMAGGVNNSVIIVYDWITKSFSKITGWKVDRWCPLSNGDLLFSSRSYILKAFSGKTDWEVINEIEAPITFRIKTKPYSLGSHHKKTLSTLYVDAKKSGSRYDVSINLESFDNINGYENYDYVVTSWQDFANTFPAAYKNFIVNIEKNSFKFQVSISDDVYNSEVNTPNEDPDFISENPIFIYTIGFVFNVLPDIADAPKLKQSLLIGDYQHYYDT